MIDGKKRCGCGEGHETFGACLRAKSLRVAYCQSAAGLDFTAQKKADRELAAYKDARAQGIQPSGTRMAQVEQALKISDSTQTAFQGV